jgi:hypothetical protein
MTNQTQLIISALETGVDLARGNAEAVHANYKGYYPERHAAADRDVSDMEAALSAARAHLEHPQASEPAFNPDWSLLEATQESLREHMAMVKAGEPAPSAINCECGRVHKLTAYGWATAEPAPSTAGERANELAEQLCNLAEELEITHYVDFMREAAALLQSPALPVGELTDQSNLATIAGLEASTGHLSVMVDELRILLARSLENFTTLHNAAKPDEDGPDIDAIIPGGVFARFVDEDAAIRYALNQTCHAEALAAAQAAPARVPLTDELVHYGQWGDGSGSSADFKEGARWAESKHGITQGEKECP